MRALGASDAREVGPYRLLVELRTDDTGRVMLGTALDGRLAAITLVDDGLVNDLFRARLRAEIKHATAGARTVHVVDGDADASAPWVATGFIPRVSLRTAITRTGPLPAASLLRLADGLAKALEELHDRGLVHGNLTGDTVLLTDIGPLLVDSGVARAAGNRTTADDLRALGTLIVDAGGSGSLGSAGDEGSAANAGNASGSHSAGNASGAGSVGSAGNAGSAGSPSGSRSAGNAGSPGSAGNAGNTSGAGSPSSPSSAGGAGSPSNPGSAGSPSNPGNAGSPGSAGSPDLTDVVAACAVSLSAVREVVGSLPVSARPWPSAVRELAVEESDRIVDLITETGRRPVEPQDAPVEHSPRTSPARFFDVILVSVTSVFVGWVMSWLVFFQDLEPSPFPSHATLLAQSDPVWAGGARVVWLVSGVAFAIFCTAFVLLVARPRTNAVPWAVLSGLSLLPVVVWGLRSAGVDVALVAAPLPVELDELAFLPAVVAAVLGAWLSSRLFPGAGSRTMGAALLGSLLVVGAVTMAGLYFGWYGVVVAGVVPLDIAGVPLGCLAGCVVARTLRPIE